MQSAPVAGAQQTASAPRLLQSGVVPLGSGHRFVAPSVAPLVAPSPVLPSPGNTTGAVGDSQRAELSEQVVSEDTHVPDRHELTTSHATSAHATSRVIGNVTDT